MVEPSNTRWVCRGVYDSSEAANIAVSRERVSHTGLMEQHNVKSQVSAVESLGNKSMYSQTQVSPIMLVSAEAGPRSAEYFLANSSGQQYVSYIQSETAGLTGNVSFAGRTAFQQESLQGLPFSAVVNGKRTPNVALLRKARSTDEVPDSKRARQASESQDISVRSSETMWACPVPSDKPSPASILCAMKSSGSLNSPIIFQQEHPQQQQLQHPSSMKGLQLAPGPESHHHHIKKYLTDSGAPIKVLQLKPPSNSHLFSNQNSIQISHQQTPVYESTQQPQQLLSQQLVQLPSGQYVLLGSSTQYSQPIPAPSSASTAVSTGAPGSRTSTGLLRSLSLQQQQQQCHESAPVQQLAVQTVDGIKVMTMDQVRQMVLREQQDLQHKHHQQQQQQQAAVQQASQASHRPTLHAYPGSIAPQQGTNAHYLLNSMYSTGGPTTPRSKPGRGTRPSHSFSSAEHMNHRRNKRPGRVPAPHADRGGLHHITQGPDGRWKAQLWSKGKMYYSKRFVCAESAARAADLLIYKAQGPSAETNFPVSSEVRSLLDTLSLEQVGRLTVISANLHPETIASYIRKVELEVRNEDITRGPAEPHDRLHPGGLSLKPALRRYSHKGSMDGALVATETKRWSANPERGNPHAMVLDLHKSAGIRSQVPSEKLVLVETQRGTGFRLELSGVVPDMGTAGKREGVVEDAEVDEDRVYKDQGFYQVSVCSSEGMEEGRADSGLCQEEEGDADGSQGHDVDAAVSGEEQEGVREGISLHHNVEGPAIIKQDHHELAAGSSEDEEGKACSILHKEEDVPSDISHNEVVAGVMERREILKAGAILSYNEGGRMGSSPGSEGEFTSWEISHRLVGATQSLVV
ncbi:hypothetical protein CEUSTIGMA_g2554.t1 [Chlamydomonas eustigma]|uniref:AP2/ERF domain-containing protein n=1 Tax=Chlamydomonas eustigma TaxID=1157962 RepID=A0A250WX53_9CHLO|nr:hypothetical protein CEUSTIGMA_g2554.t1 [Chlamydomonas eustigma]|eukprot:GAX75110.1 hypothetical protein CEUSTIGMA_g2554.t1 [Chlamydomonas eustigma]